MKHVAFRLTAAAALVAVVAIHAVVHVAADVVVMEIGCVIVPMATRALEHRVIVRIGMASRTDAVRVPVSLWEVRMVKRRSCPRNRGVAGVASGREMRG